uniref:Uncharacterized protein n=1 Tax=Lynx canadensis TaxID=61383 RepID=A0A667H3Q3_LYNCA
MPLQQKVWTPQTDIFLWQQNTIKPWRHKELNTRPRSLVAVELNIFNPKVLYFTRLDRKPSVGVHQTQFYCQNPRLELDVRTRLVGASTVVAMQRPPSPEEHRHPRSFQTDISTMIQSCNLGAKDSKRSPVHFFCIRLCING